MLKARRPCDSHPVLQLVALLALLTLTGTLPREASAQADELIPLDSAYTTGTLDNGLTYFIRENQRPENRAALWLAVNAGSILEEDDQQGLAHFLEHMAFNGTRDFEKQELVDYLESIGMRFGPDLNAYTSFDETVYMLEVPMDSVEVLDQALLIMENWASGITLDAEEIDKERGVVLEEMRAGKGAGARVRDKQFPTLLKGSAYPDRIPIGTEEVLSTAPPKAFQRFYERWYRPDNMAVIAVGDFSASDMEARIRDRFSGIPLPDSDLDRPTHPVPPHDETLVTVITDPELPSTSFVVYHLFPKRNALTEADNRRAFVEGVYHGMLNLRFAELRQEPDAPFLFAGSGSGSMVRSTDAHIQTAQAKEGQVLEALEKVLTEIERVDRFGFTESEIERARTNVLRSLESALAEKDKRPSARHAGEALNHFLTGSALPGLEFNVAQAQREIPTITIEEVNALARETTSQGSRVIAVTGPEKEGVDLPTEAELLATFDRVRADTTIQAWEDNVLERPLVPEKPRLSIVVREETHPEIGVTEWELRNGVKVILKPTDFQNDEVILLGFSPGGTSQVEDDEYGNARFASGVVSAGGLAEFDPIQLGKALTGKIASASTTITGYEESVRGRASPEDLETMFQLVYLEFTQPRLDSTLAQVFLNQLTEQIRNTYRQPESVFSREIGQALYGTHPRNLELSEEAIQSVDIGKALEFYQDRFADASDFTFVLVGNFEPQAIKPLVMTWLGGLPSTRREESWRDVFPKRPETVTQVNVWKGLEAKSRVEISMGAETSWTRQESHDLTSLAAALRITLREELREEMGGVYGVSVSGGMSARPDSTYSFRVEFGCAPENAAELEQAVFAEFERAKREGFSEEVITKVRESQRRSRETSLEQNGFWASQLAAYYRSGTDPNLILAYDELVDSVSADRLQAAARRYLKTDGLVIARLFPE